MIQSDATQPNWRPEYWSSYLAPLWERVNDCYVGLHTVAAKQKYLKQQLGEHDMIYARRVETVAFENRLSPSVKSHAGLLSEFELDDDAPQSLVENMDSVDGQRNSLYSVLLDWDVQGLLYNATLALIDMPVVDDNSQLRGDRNPRIVPIKLKDVYAPRVDLVDGELKIIQIAIRRSITVRDGQFGYKHVNRFWVYRLEELATPIRRRDVLQRHGVTFTIWDEIDDSMGDYEMVQEPTPILDASGQQIEAIPIVWYSPYGDPILFHGVDNDDDRGGTPEYLPLIDLNFEYFNKHSELNTAESRGNFVMLNMAYPGPAPQKQPDLLTSGRVVVTEGGAELRMLEPAGTAISSTRDGQRDRLKRMDVISQAFLTGGEMERTATEAMIESSQSRLGLRNIARRKESAVQNICYWWERFANPEFQMGDRIGGITVSESVLSLPPSPEMLNRVDEQYLNGQLTKGEWEAKMTELGYYTEEMRLARENDGSLPLNLNGMGVVPDGV